MEKKLRGRPLLKLTMPLLLEAMRRHGTVLGAARELHCSDAYIHGRLKAAGLTLADVLAAPSVEALLKALG